MQCAELLNNGERFFNHIILVFHETFIIHMFPVLSWIKLFLQVEEHFQLNLTHICMSLHQRWNYLIRSDRVENGCKNAWNCFSSYYCTFHISHALSPQCRTIFYKCLNSLTWFHQHNCCISARSDWVDIKMCGKIVRAVHLTRVKTLLKLEILVLWAVSDCVTTGRARQF